MAENQFGNVAFDIFEQAITTKSSAKVPTPVNCRGADATLWQQCYKVAGGFLPLILFLFVPFHFFSYVVCLAIVATLKPFECLRLNPEIFDPK